MLIELIVLVVLIGIIAFYTFIEGLFEAAMSLAAAMFALMVAGGFYESLVEGFLAQRMPDYARPVAFGTLFCLTFLILRMVARYAIPNRITFPWYIDRPGGGLMGLFVGMTVLGAALVTIQMLPLPADILGYNRYNKHLKPVGKLFPNVDGWAVGLIETASHGALSGQVDFKKTHRDFLLELWGNRQEPAETVLSQSMRSMPRNTEENKVLVITHAYISGLKDDDYERLILRTRIKDTARDPDSYLRLKGTQLRLVDTRGKSYYCQGLHWEGGTFPPFTVTGGSRITKVDRDAEKALVRVEAHDGRLWWKGEYQRTRDITGDPTGPYRALPATVAMALLYTDQTPEQDLDLVFLIPQGESPWYLQAKCSARAEVPELVEGVPSVLGYTRGEFVSLTMAMLNWPAEGLPSPLRGKFARITDRLPMVSGKKMEVKLTSPDEPYKKVAGAYQSDAEFTDYKLVQGKLVGQINRFRVGMGGKLTNKLEVPDGFVLIEVICEKGPTYSEHFLSNGPPRLLSEAGESFDPVGGYAAFSRADDIPFIELYYHARGGRLPGSFQMLTDRRPLVRAGFYYRIPKGRNIKLNRFQYPGVASHQTFNLRIP